MKKGVFMAPFNFFKMKHTLVIITLFLQLAYCKGQDYSEYHFKVNIAKVLIVNGQFDSALETYHSVFREFTKKFYRDIHNACVCSIKTENWDDAYLFAKELILHGYILEDFDKSTFKLLRSNNCWNDIKREYPHLRKQYKDKIESYQYLKYRYMKSYDQHLTGLDNYEDHNKAIYEFTRLLILDYESNGIPNFCRYKDRMRSTYLTFYRHFFGKRGRALNSGSYQYVERLDSLQVKQLLKNEVLKGNLSPRFLINAESYFENEFGILSEIEINIDFEKQDVFFIPSKKKTYDFIPPYPNIDFETIDSNRASLGILPLVEEANLFKVGTWYTQYPFKEVEDVLESLNGESMQIIKKKIKEIESHTRKSFKSNNIHEDFFLTDYYSYKHTKYTGLEKYVTDNQ